MERAGERGTETLVSKTLAKKKTPVRERLSGFSAKSRGRQLLEY